MKKLLVGAVPVLALGRWVPTAGAGPIGYYTRTTLAKSIMAYRER
jgi:hypothetical protein